MSKLSEKTIEELQQILKEEYGKEMTRAEASEIACALVGYFDTLGKINGHIENNKTQQNTKNNN